VGALVVLWSIGACMLPIGPVRAVRPGGSSGSGDGIEEDFAMAVRIVRLGSPRVTGEGTRIGTVRRPPRGVPKSQFASQNWYDVWFPNLAPSVATMKLGQAVTTAAQWAAFTRKYRAEMATPETTRTIELLAALSRHASFSVGCYCEDESRCHRSLLRALLLEKGATIV
jgi:uncharacterized protein YeaO (DUF488 family)